MYGTGCSLHVPVPDIEMSGCKWKVPPAPGEGEPSALKRCVHEKDFQLNSGVLHLIQKGIDNKCLQKTLILPNTANFLPL